MLVTGRADEGPWGAEVRRAVGGLMPIVFAAGRWKASAAKAAGYKVDVWIDDSPEGIRELAPEALAFKRAQEQKATESRWEKLVRDRDRWKRKALDRAADRSPDRRREIEARDLAVERILFAVAIEGILSHAARGARGCLWKAIEALRPDIAATMENGLEDDAHEALRRFFPRPEDLEG